MISFLLCLYIYIYIKFWMLPLEELFENFRLRILQRFRKSGIMDFGDGELKRAGWIWFLWAYFLGEGSVSSLLINSNFDGGNLFSLKAEANLLFFKKQQKFIILFLLWFMPIWTTLAGSKSSFVHLFLN